GLGTNYAPTGGLRKGLDDDLVNVHVRWPGHRELDAARNILRRHRLHALVDLARRLRIAAEADARELRLHKAGVDRRDVDRAAEEIFAQAVSEAAHRELGGHVDRRLLVRLPACGRAEVDDVTAVANGGQERA